MKVKNLSIRNMEAQMLLQLYVDTLNHIAEKHNVIFPKEMMKENGEAYNRCAKGLRMAILKDCEHKNRHLVNENNKYLKHYVCDDCGLEF